MKLQHSHEKIVETFNYNDAVVEIVEWTETIWCGKIGYAENNTDEPNVDNILSGYHRLSKSKLDGKFNPVRDGCISVNYLSADRPNGVMFCEMVKTAEQPKDFDILHIPATQYLRILINPETAKAIGKEPWFGGIPPYDWIYEVLAPYFGYKPGDDTLPIIEYYGHYKQGEPKIYDNKLCYLYAPVVKI